MARKYSKAAQEKIGEVMREFKEGALKSSSGNKVTDRDQAIAIGISEARSEGKKVPSKKSSKKTATKKSATKKVAVKKSAIKKAAKKVANKKSTTKKAAPKESAAKTIAKKG